MRPLTPTRALTSALPTTTRREAPPAAVPLRRPSPTAAPHAVQRIAAAKPTQPQNPPSTPSPVTKVAHRRLPNTPKPPPTTPQAPPVTPASASAPTPTPIQRAPAPPLRPAPTPTPKGPTPTPTTPTPTTTTTTTTPPPDPQFDPRSLTDFQLDELTHKLIGRVTRLVRTELRLDRERIGKLRDPRH
ncbi:extensin [Streptomyces capitiformicae]|uniref:extensin n=1 Tax=Streptomyces capitiformicae TaxID=2014920 RepID=UPI001673ACBE|nr:extensin [Streptomyces capitiformicae]